jgi:hypothetical protein
VAAEKAKYFRIQDNHPAQIDIAGTNPTGRGGFKIAPLPAPWSRGEGIKGVGKKQGCSRLGSFRETVLSFENGLR